MKLREILKSEYVQAVILVAIVIAGYVAFFFGLRAALKTEYPLLAVETGSMQPTLQIGDLLVVQGGLNASEIKVGYTDGDIIVFRGEAIYREGVLIVHRAIKKVYIDGVCYLTTHGDNNSPSAVEEFSEDYLIGKVVGRVPLLGYISLFFEPPAAKMALIIIMIIILILTELVPFSMKKVKEGQNQAFIRNPYLTL